MTYPLHLDLLGKRVLVVGAGTIASRRVAGLIDAGADIVVVAPQASMAVQQWAADGALEWEQRPFGPRDLADAWLVHAATDDAAVNALIESQARAQRIWCIRADQSGDARTPAAASADGVVVSVTSNDPGRSIRIRDAVAEQLRAGFLSTRATRPHDGAVVLIGGGPGDPDLITVRGRRELAAADVVVYDRLAPTALLDELDPDVELIDAGKLPGHHALPQDAINAVIVARALEGKRVVRLKGGDPFVLGRGSEEVIACAEAGVPVSVIPGISSALSAPLAAGIPVTHRGTSVGFVVVSGHALSDLTALAATDLTLVILMGVANLSALAEGLVDQGRDADTPVAVIERAYADDQRVTIGSLATIAELAEAAQVSNPAVIVVGDVVTVPAVVTAAGLTATMHHA